MPVHMDLQEAGIRVGRKRWRGRSKTSVHLVTDLEEPHSYRTKVNVYLAWNDRR
jgi:hypothetical protein